MLHAGSSPAPISYLFFKIDKFQNDNVVVKLKFMALRVKVELPKSFLISFLQTKGFLLVSNKPQILHFFGKNKSELKSALKEDKPDLLINHSFPSFKSFPDQSQVYHFLRNEKDLLRLKQIHTNNFSLCKYYYQSMGLQEEIKIVETKKKKEETGNILRLPNFQIFNWTEKFWKSFRSFMIWD